MLGNFVGFFKSKNTGNCIVMELTVIFQQKIILKKLQQNLACD